MSDGYFDIVHAHGGAPGDEPRPQAVTDPFLVIKPDCGACVRLKSDPEVQRILRSLTGVQVVCMDAGGVVTQTPRLVRLLDDGTARSVCGKDEIIKELRAVAARLGDTTTGPIHIPKGRYVRFVPAANVGSAGSISADSGFSEHLVVPWDDNTVELTIANPGVTDASGHSRMLVFSNKWRDGRRMDVSRLNLRGGVQRSDMEVPKSNVRGGGSHNLYVVQRGYATGGSDSQIMSGRGDGVDLKESSDTVLMQGECVAPDKEARVKRGDWVNNGIHDMLKPGTYVETGDLDAMARMIHWYDMSPIDPATAKASIPSD